MKTVAVIPTRFWPDTLNDLIDNLDYLDEHDLLIVLDDREGTCPPADAPLYQRFKDTKTEIWHLEDHFRHNLYGMWNYAWALSLERYPDEEVNLAFLNDDIIIGTQEFLAPLAHELRSEPDRGVVSPDYRTDVYHTEHGPDLVHGTYRNGGICGWAFMIAAEWRQTKGVPPVDEQFRWWCGDDDLVRQYEKAGAKPAVVTGLPVGHIGEFSSNQVPELHQIKYDDLKRFEAKYG